MNVFVLLSMAFAQVPPPPPVRSPLITPTPVLSPSQVYLLCYSDALTLTPEIAEQTRWLWLPNLPDRERTVWKAALNGHCNSLSNQSDLTPLRVLADGHLYAFNLLDYGWTPETWDKFADSDPTFTAFVITEKEVEEYWQGGTVGGKVYEPGRYTQVKKTKTRVAAPWLVRSKGSEVAAKNLRTLTHCEAPVVNALVFFPNTASSGVGSPDYYDMQGIKNEADFFKLVGAEVAKDVDFSTDLLASVGISGITQEPRALQRIDKRGGALWQSFDKKKGTAVDKGNPLRILGSDKDGKLFLDFDATEKFAHGANGLWKFFLGNNKGEKQAAAPDTVAQDGVAIMHNSHAVIVGVSCIRCHTNGGMQDISDFARNFPPEMDILAGDRLGKKIISYAEVRKLRQQYTRKLESFLTQDRARYASSLKAITGLTPEEYALAFSSRWDYAVNSEVDSVWAARELGVDPAVLELAIKHQVDLRKADPVLANMVLPQARRKKIAINQWREVYGLAQTYIAEIGK